jgi:NAD+ synthase (glutamine-hydrolysing)
MHGFYRVATAVNKTTIANPKANSVEIIELIVEAYSRDVGVVVFPELTLTGYTSSDLFFQQTLYESQNRAIEVILEATRDISTIATIGMALLDNSRLYNCGMVIQYGKILGIVPKSYIPNNREFYEKRHFSSGRDILKSCIEFLGEEIPFGVDLLFRYDNNLIFGVEICEDLWAISPPSSDMASSGATLILNLSASNELIGKAQYRESLVRSQSAKAMCAYIYSSSGVGESTTDTLFGGDTMICEYGSLLARGRRFERENQLVCRDVDLEKIVWLRLSEGSFADSRSIEMSSIKLSAPPTLTSIDRAVPPHPFVPPIEESIDRCEEIVLIQAHSLIKRMTHAHISKAHIGISGGLDSTLALLSTHKAFEIMGWDYSNIIAVTMAGFGTTTRTKNNAILLSTALGVTLKSVDIRTLSLKEFEAIGHDRDIQSVTYENVQARARTSILMNMANREGGLVIGTGDLSEIALGWSTYNGDHMSMYALNSGIPKTLIRYVIDYFSTNPKIASILKDILDTPISPELLPHSGDKIVQETESIIGPYELHDFFLYHTIRYGAKPSKILYLAEIAFKDSYDRETITKWLRLFVNRFFTQQFKRSCMPDGPKIGTINLSPRADWRMASDADREVWLDELSR